MPLTLIPTNTKNTIIQAADINSIINVLQQPSGGQEKGHYILAMPGYAVNATLSWYEWSISRGATPVSVTLDTSDVTASGMQTATPSTDHLTANGFHVFDFAATGPQPNPIAGGLYTIQY